MRNLTLLALVSLSAACATRTHTALTPSHDWRVSITEEATVPQPTAAMHAPASAAAPAPALLGGDGYTKFSLGVFEPAGDIDELDSGYYAQVAFGGDVIPLISLEASLGYAQAEGSGNSEVMLIPLLINGRVQVPILIVKAYGGLGVGGAFASFEAGPFDDDEFLLAGTAFLGAEVGLGNLAVGVEYRYLTTEETDADFAIEGHCGLVTLTLPF